MVEGLEMICFKIISNVGDEDEGLALSLQTAHNAEQVLDFFRIQCGGRLV